MSHSIISNTVNMLVLTQNARLFTTLFYNTVSVLATYWISTQKLLKLNMEIICFKSFLRYLSKHYASSSADIVELRGF